MSYEQALGAIIADSERAHRVHVQDSGHEVWRGPRPRRLRYVVEPSRIPGELPALVTVTLPPGAR